MLMNGNRIVFKCKMSIFKCIVQSLDVFIHCTKGTNTFLNEQLMISNRQICCRERHGAKRFCQMLLLYSVLFYLHLCEYKVQLHRDSASNAINCACVCKDEHQMAHTFRQKNSLVNKTQITKGQFDQEKNSLLVLNENRVLIVQQFQAVSHQSLVSIVCIYMYVCNCACFFSTISTFTFSKCRNAHFS